MKSGLHYETEQVTPTIVIAEKGLKWLAAVRTCVRRSCLFQARPVWIHVPTAADVQAKVSSAPAALVILEVMPENAASHVVQLDQWREAFPAACFLAALDRRCGTTRRSEWVRALREAGAAHVLISVRRVAEVLPLLARHARFTSANAPPAHQRQSGLAFEWAELVAIDLPACWSSATYSASASRRVTDED
jgi:hypothetical protein